MKDFSRFAGPTDAFRRRTIHGAFTTTLGQAVKLIVQFGSVILLSRLIPPDSFGVFAMVAPVYGLVLMFQDLGLSQATIQRAEITSQQVTNLFWINVGISAGLALLLAASAPLIGLFYADERTVHLTLAFAALLIISGFTSQHLALISRQMRFGYLAVLDAGSYVAGFIGAVTVAWFIPNFWALFASAVVTLLFTALAAWTGCGWRPGLPRRGAGTRDLLNYGGGITGFNLFNFFARNADNILIGRTWGDVPLGLYDRAYKLLLFPLQQVNNPLSRVMLPILSRLQYEPERYRLAYLKTLQQVLLLTQPGIIFLIATADWLIPTLLGSRWHDAVPIFMWLGLAGLQQPMNSTMGWLFMSQGRTREFMQWGAFSASTCIIAFVIGLPWGPVGVAAAYSLSDVFLRMPILWWFSTRKGPVRLRDLCATAMPFVAANLVSFATIYGLRSVSNLDPIPGMAISLCLSYTAMLVVLAILPSGRRILRETLGVFSSIIQRA